MVRTLPRCCAGQALEDFVKDLQAGKRDPSTPQGFAQDDNGVTGLHTDFVAEMFSTKKTQ